MTASIKRPLFAAMTLALVTGATGANALAQETAPPPPPPSPVGGTVGYFGERGQFAVSLDLQLNFIRTSTSTAQGEPGGSSINFLFQPAADYFVSTNFSVGGAIGLGRETGDFLGSDVTLTTFALSPRVGYNVVLTPAVSLWIRGGFGYERLSFSGAGLDQSGYRIPLYVYAPVLWHPASHFFLGFGPVFSTDLVSKTQSGDEPTEDAQKFTQFGLQSTVGGYFGGL